MTKSENFLHIFLFSSFFKLLLASELENVTLSNLTVHKIRREVLDYKKYLLFPQGSNVQEKHLKLSVSDWWRGSIQESAPLPNYYIDIWLVYCMTIGTYARPGGFFTMGVTAGLAYELPHKRTVPFRKPAEVYHRRSRRDLYRKIELMLKTQGKDGRACVLKALCNAGKRNSTKVGKGSFMEEILHSIFTLPAGSYHLDPRTEYEEAHETDVDCDKAFPSCAESIFN